jgi:hypothetical protein
LLIYALAIVFLSLAWHIHDAPPIPWLFPPIGLLMLVVAASFHHRTVEDSLPNYRLSKFQPLMPDWVERDVLSNHLLDITGTRAWLHETRNR